MPRRGQIPRLVALDPLREERVFVVAAVVTPPDPISQITLAIPLCLLYEISIMCVWLIERRKKRDEASKDAKALVA